MIGSIILRAKFLFQYCKSRQPKTGVMQQRRITPVSICLTSQPFWRWGRCGSSHHRHSVRPDTPASFELQVYDCFADYTAALPYRLAGYLRS